MSEARTIPEMIRDGDGEFSSSSLLRDGVEASGNVLFAADRIAAAERIEALEAQASDAAMDALVAHGQASDALAEQKRLEAEVARLREALIGLWDASAEVHNAAWKFHDEGLESDSLHDALVRLTEAHKMHRAALSGEGAKA